MTNDAPAVSDPAPASTPTLLNDPVVGKYIRFDPDIDWTRFWENISYEWLLDGQSNPDMSRDPWYRVRAEDFGHRLSARVTLKEYDADPVTYTTAKSEPVLGSISGSLQYPAEPILGKALSAITSVTSTPAFSSGSESSFT